MDMGIKGKNAIVCASSRGLGKGCAMALASEGANVLINGRNSITLEKTAEEINSKFSVEVKVVCADITTEEGQEKLADQCSEPDILVNNAGIQKAQPINETSLDDWEKMMSVHQHGYST